MSGDVLGVLTANAQELADLADTLSDAVGLLHEGAEPRAVEAAASQIRACAIAKLLLLGRVLECCGRLRGAAQAAGTALLEDESRDPSGG